MPLKYKETILDNPAQWSVAEKLVADVTAKLQAISCTQVKFSKLEIKFVDTMIARLLTAPRGLIPEC